MAKRSKELFELLREQREAAEAARAASPDHETISGPASERTVEAPDGAAASEGALEPPAEPAERKSEVRNKPRLVERLTSFAARRAPEPGADRGGIGGRKVSLSLNFMLFFVVAFLLTNVMSFIVGTMQRDGEGTALSVKLNKFYAVQVTELLDPEKERRFAWDLRSLLIEAGFPRAEVYRTTLNNRTYLRTIASKHTDENACRRDAHRVSKAVAGLVQSGKLERDAAMLINISTISIQETAKNRNSSSHVNP